MNAKAQKRIGRFKVPREIIVCRTFSGENQRRVIILG